MTAPTVFDFGQLKIGDGVTPTEGFTLVCGLETVKISEAVETSKSYIRDCQAPATPPKARVKSKGYSWSASAAGLCNTAQMALLKTALGKKGNYKIVALDTTDPSISAGTVIGTFSGSAVLSARNISSIEDGFASLELTLEGDGDLTYA